MTLETPPYWPAPHVTGPVRARVTAPGSKSLTNRLLLMAALGDTETTVIGALESDDSTAMRRGLCALGAHIQDTVLNGEAALRVTPISQGTPEPHRVIDVNQAGTVMRFLPLVAALLPGTTDFTAHASALGRPMGPLFSALRSAGLRVTALDGDAAATADPATPTHLPVRIAGRTGDGSDLSFEVDATASSQFLSALLIGVNAQTAPAVIRHTGGRIPSRGHVDMTVETLRSFGVVVEEIGADTWRVTPGIRSPETIRVEQDLSNAGPFLAAAMVTGGRVEVPHWPAQTTQIGDRWREILPQLGAEVDWTADTDDGNSGTLVVTGPARIQPADIDDSAELAPVLAAMLALADGESRLTGIAHLRGHETDRLAALVTEIRAMGADAEETEDGLVIRGTDSPMPADHRTYHDHRMATAAAVWGLRAPGTRIETIGVTAKTMPDFPERWSSMVSAADSGEAAT